jgi:NTP pyrophosphatase (non-canonical NTP hydrolase)
MGQIRDMQIQHHKWLRHNFPDQTDHQPLLGIVEEVGELAHAALKHEQAIRGMTYSRAREAEKDALGDIFIYMMSYANSRALDLEAIITETWGQVQERDWRRYPETGRPSADT